MQLLLLSVLNCVYETISQILRKNVEKRALFDNLDVCMLALDEICDGGVVLEADPAAVVARVAIRTDDIPLGEQTVAQVNDLVLKKVIGGRGVTSGGFLRVFSQLHPPMVDGVPTYGCIMRTRGNTFYDAECFMQ